MFKLVDFISSQKNGKKGKKGKKSKDEDLRKIVFSSSEKQEIKKTIGTLNRDASMVLTNTLQELNLKSLAKDLELEDILHFTDDDKKQTTDSGSEETDDSSPAGTFRIKNLKDESRSSGEYSSGTFRVKDYGNGDSDNEDNFGTFCIKNVSSSDIDTNESGTFRMGNEGGSSKQSESAPDFSKMFREPEDWEKYILALEKGEWAPGMEQNGAFKRWKKERPSMPSIYLKSSTEGSS